MYLEITVHLRKRNRKPMKPMEQVGQIGQQFWIKKQTNN